MLNYQRVAYPNMEHLGTSAPYLGARDLAPFVARKTVTSPCTCTTTMDRSLIDWIRMVWFCAKWLKAKCRVTLTSTIRNA